MLVSIIIIVITCWNRMSVAWYILPIKTLDQKFQHFDSVYGVFTFNLFALPLEINIRISSISFYTFSKKVFESLFDVNSEFVESYNYYYLWPSTFHLNVFFDCLSEAKGSLIFTKIFRYAPTSTIWIIVMLNTFSIIPLLCAIEFCWDSC